MSARMKEAAWVLLGFICVGHAIIAQQHAGIVAMLSLATGWLLRSLFVSLSSGEGA